VNIFYLSAILKFNAPSGLAFYRFSTQPCGLGYVPSAFQAEQDFGGHFAIRRRRRLPQSVPLLQAVTPTG